MDMIFNRDCYHSRAGLFHHSFEKEADHTTGGGCQGPTGGQLFY